MNKKQLEYFIAVYENLNIQHTADKLHVSRQGISKIIHLLEKELGQQLFKRTAHGLSPTDYATLLLPHAQRLLEEYNYIEGMNTLASQAKSVITIYALDHIFTYFGAQLLIDFHQAFPDLILSIVDTTDDNALEAVNNGKCNLAIVTGPLDQNLFQGEPIFFSSYCACMHKNHPLANLPSLSYSDLEGYNIISKGRAYKCFRHNIDKYILLPKINVNILAETTDISLIEEILEKELAINIGYDYTASLFTSSDIIKKPISTENDYGQYIYFVESTKRMQTSTVKKFKQFLLTWLRENHPDFIK